MPQSGRVWAVPLLFVLVILAMPAQHWIMERYDDEPYPGLRMPQFDGDAQDNGVVELTVASLRDASTLARCG